MEKRTAGKAKKWNNEMVVERRRRVEREQSNQKAASGEYIPRRYVEPIYNKAEIKARNNERLLIYFFIGVIACILIWKGFDVLRERYWMDELKTGSQQLLTTLERENQRTRNELNKLTSSYKPINANPYQIKTRDFYKGSVCREHVKTEIYERKTLKCHKKTNQCTTISSKTYNKEGHC